MAKERKPKRSQSDMRGPSRMAWFLFALAIVPFGLGTWGAITDGRLWAGPRRKLEF